MKGFPAIGVAVLALVLAVCLAGPAPAAPEGRPGEVELSDGTVIRGRIRFTAGRTLTILVRYQGRHGQKERVEPAHLARLEMVIESESMERPYTFKNPGDPTKTYGEGHYPVRNLSGRLTLLDGRVLEGDLISTVVYVRPEGQEDWTRHKIVRQQKGKVGETLDDLTYLKAIRWREEGAAFDPATIRGRFPLPDALEEVVAYHHETKRIFPGDVVDAKRGIFEIWWIPAGTYDVFLRTTREFAHPFAPLPAEAPPGAPNRLTQADRAAVQAATGQAADFFEERHVGALAGTPKAARALVLKDRVGKTSNESALEGAKLWRLEIWLWHRLETEWRLDRRLYLFRGTREAGHAARTLRLEGRLRGLRVEAGGTLKVGEPSPGSRR